MAWPSDNMLFESSAVIDGTANTIYVSEAKIAGPRVARNVSGLPSKPALVLEAVKNDRADFWPEGRQACWADGSLRSVGFQTILPPGSPSATSDKGELEGVMSASSYHLADGVHALFADGHIRFIRSSIDAGDRSQPSVADQPGLAPPNSPSPYGIWGALGTRLGGERVDRSDPSIAPPPFELDDNELKKITSKPPRIWTASNETSTVKAWYVNIIDQSVVLLLLEDRQIRPIPLRMLSSKDAYLGCRKTLANRASGISCQPAGDENGPRRPETCRRNH